eukprot:12802-Pelagomonas_calceolata.AAC.2
MGWVRQRPNIRAWQVLAMTMLANRSAHPPCQASPHTPARAQAADLEAGMRGALTSDASYSMLS